MIGTRYKAIKREYGDLFQIGDIVVSLDDDDAPFCIKEEYYKEGTTPFDYDYNLVYAMSTDELEGI